MKSALLVENGRIELASIAQTTLGADECRVAVRNAGICSSDVARAFQGGAYFYPLVMGHELAGEIVEIGSDVRGRKIGERVTVFPLLPCFRCDACQARAFARCRSYDYYGSRRHGGFAESLAVKSWNLLRIPDAVSLENAALTEPTAVVVHALDRGGLTQKPDQGGVPTGASVALLGAGFLGQIAARILSTRRPDLRLHVFDRNAFKIDMVRPYCADGVTLRGEVAWADFVKRHAASFDVAIEAVGAPETFRRSIDLVAPGGTAVWMGNISGDLAIPKAMVSSLLRKEIKLLGTWNSSYDGNAPSDWTHALDLMAAGLDPASLVTLRVDLEGLPEAMRKLDAHRRRVESHDIVKVLMRNA